VYGPGLLGITILENYCESLVTAAPHLSSSLLVSGINSDDFQQALYDLVHIFVGNSEMMYLFAVTEQFEI